MRRCLCAVLVVLLSWSEPGFAQQIRLVRPVDPTGYETRRPTKEIAIYLDRHAYWPDDGLAHALVVFNTLAVEGKTCTVEVAKAGAAAPPNQRRQVRMTTPKLEVMIDLRRMTPGDYVLRAAVDGVDEAKVETPLRVEPSGRRLLPVPADGIAIEVQPQTADRNGAWPITTGVPFPHGVLARNAPVTLYENGQPVPSQFTVATTWEPDAPGYTPHVRWGHLTFIAKYDDGKPRDYRLKLGNAPAAQPRVNVEAAGNTITVDTGAVKFTVNRKQFDGIHEAWLDADGDGMYGYTEQAVRAAEHQGPYVIDDQGVVFTAKADITGAVRVEQDGPLRVVIVAEGWYANTTMPAERRRFCRYNTRLIAHAGQREITVEHHTIVTFNTDDHQIADLGFALPTGGLGQWRAGIDTETVTGSAPMMADQRAFVHQYRWNKARLVNVDGKQRDAGRSDGYLTALPLSQQQPAVTVALRDIWQKFPKELSVGRDDITVHFWPEHGIETFTADEMHARENIYKLWWFHHGKLLDLAFPQDAYDVLKEWDQSSTFGERMGDPEGTIESALGAYGEGLVIGNDFLVTLHPREDETAAQRAAMFQLDPWARPAATWATATGVEDQIAPRNDEAYPKLESYLDRAHVDLMNVQVGLGTEWGMWIYANTHNHWDALHRRAHLHRVWQASHYRMVYGPWLLLFRGASFDNLPWARAAVDHYMNISTINWSNPDAPLRWHQAGAMYHAKGFTPWGATRAGQKMKADVGLAGIANHFVNPDAMLMKWLMTGDGRARDVYQLWVDAVTDAWGGGLSSREYVNTFGELLNTYRNFHDPRLLKPIHRAWKPITEQEPGKLLTMPHQYAHSVWHEQYLFRLYNQVRDPAIIDAVRAYAEVYRGHASANAFLAVMTGDKAFAHRNIEGIYNWIRQEYLNPGDPIHGFDHTFHATGMRFVQSVPYWIHAAQRLGIEEVAPVGRATFIYPYTGGRFNTGIGSPTSIDALVLDTDDQPINIFMEGLSGIDQHAMNMYALSPSGKPLVERPYTKENRQLRYIGDNALRYTLPSDGETGLYHVQVRSHMVVFKAPYTDAAVEGVRLDRDRPYSVIGKSDFFYQPVGGGALTLKFEGITDLGSTTVAYVRVLDADNNLMLETTLLAGSQRSVAEITIDPTQTPGPYRIETIAGRGPAITWSGDATSLVLAADPNAAVRLVEALAEKQ